MKDESLTSYNSPSSSGETTTPSPATMEPSATFSFKKSPRSSSSSSLLLTTIIPVALLILLSSFLFTNFHHHSSTPPPLILQPPPPPPPHPLIKTTCTTTLYPSLCFNTLSSNPINLHHDNHTRTRNILKFSIQKTIYRLSITRSKIASLNSKLQYHNWVQNCLELLDLSQYELQESMNHLSPPYDDPPPYASIKNLLSAAMTNENTCIEGFSDLKLNGLSKTRFGRLFQKTLTPIMRMISNCLAITNYLETIGSIYTFKDPQLMSKGVYRDHVPSWMTAADRRLMQTTPKIIPLTVVVARDGIGNFTTIGAAVAAAPSRGKGRHVIQIKAGIYHENLVIPRNKANIMLVGDGMNSTIITSNKNFVDGYTTFTSATLTVVGNNFLARDLTIMNTSGPEKHQAVALRVTSDAAFYHCQFISHQDTLYAHSLSQLYRECAIHGTIDFIFGNAAAIFERCLILVRKPILGQKNVITAQGRLDPNQNTGISLQDCTIMAAPDFKAKERANFSTFLGRPWRNYSRTIVMRSYLGDIIDPQGWCPWNEYNSNLETVEYIEYNNFGPGADTRKRVRWAGYHNNSKREVEKMGIQSFLHGADEWLKSTEYLPLCSGLYAKYCKTGSAQA